jgi:hypothetical protein
MCGAFRFNIFGADSVGSGSPPRAISEAAIKQDITQNVLRSADSGVNQVDLGQVINMRLPLPSSANGHLISGI